MENNSVSRKTGTVPGNARTNWAERHVEEFLSQPFISEFVFRGLQTISGGSQKEVADFFITCERLSVLVSQKCQEDPSSRDLTETENWCRKKAYAAVKQLTGALRTGSKKEIWCEHTRRGKVIFRNGLPKIDHGVVILEAAQIIDLEPESTNVEFKLPLVYQDTPIHYFSLNDFLNLTDQLRTLPELVAYLDARQSLPTIMLREIGDEKTIFNLYLLREGSFGACNSKAEAKIEVTEHRRRFQEIVMTRQENNIYSHLLEKVAHELATRDPLLPMEMQSQYEPLDQRVGYLKMQSILADMQLRDRIALGKAFFEIIASIEANNQGFAFRAVLVDSLQDFVFVFGSSKNWDRKELIDLLPKVVQAGMAHFHKTVGLMVVDRDRAGFEVIYIKSPSPPTDQRLIDFGRKNFGKTTGKTFDFR